MIQQNHHSIYVQLLNGEKVPFLAQTVAKVFCKSESLSAGMEPWQVEEIAEALIHHLRVDLKCDTIAFGDFVHALSKLTAACGYHKAVQNEALPQADLYRLAQETGYGFELAFFQSVERSIHEFRRTNTSAMRFVGLRRCVKLLVGARSWGKTCQQLNDEIVVFIRSHMLQGADADPVAFAVSQ